MRTIALLPTAGLIAGALACGSSNNQQGFGNPDDGGSSSSGGGSGGSSGSSGGSGGSSGGFGDASSSSSGGQTGPAIIYANTDTELWTMDPNTHALTDVGPFSFGGGTTPTITDLAVDANGIVVVNSETAVYDVTLPAGGTGTVNLALHTQLPSGSKFYALGFTPAGALESGESLIAGDSAGNLYYIPSSATATPQLLGGFGGNWELSGDVVFYTANGATIGLATIRDCPGGTCTKTNDSLAEIDVPAMKQAFTSNSPGTLLKQVFGSGTGYGDLFGIGAWGNSVYAFSRASGGNPAQLVQVGMSGTGTSLMQFPNITGGWSGAGVTTKAPITVVVQ
jgi:hypothetical protein